MRVTEGMRGDAVNRSLSSLAAKQAEAARKASTGERVGTPSDDPIAAAELTRLSAARARNEAFSANVSSARGDAEIAEGTLGEAGQALVRVRELAMLGANGTLGATERASLADEVASLKQHLVTLANAKGQNGFLFAGTLTTAAPFDVSGTFLGNDGAHQVEIATGLSVRGNPSGENAFTATGGVDAFDTLDALEAALRANDAAAVTGTLTDIDAAREQIERERSGAGLLLNRLETTDAALSLSEVTLSARSTAVGQADPFEAYSELTALSGTLEQSLSVARILLSTGQNRF